MYKEQYMAPIVRTLFVDQITKVLASSAFGSNSSVLTTGQENDGEYDFEEEGYDSLWFN